MGDCDEHPDIERSSVRLDRIPVPTTRYALRDDAVVVTERNERFAASFAGSDPGTPIRRWFEQNDLSADDGTVADLCSSLRAGEPADVTVSIGDTPQGYRLRAAPDPGSRSAGTLTMTSGPERSGMPADEHIASVVSHDLRNPLDVAKAHLTAARETGDPDHFESIERAHDRMEQIIGDVLTLARGKGALNQSQGVELGAVASDAWDTVDTGRASVTVADGLPTVEADRDRLQRLFENLYRNTVEHGSHDDSSTVAGRLEPTDEAPGEADPGVVADGSEPAGVTVRVGETEHGFYVADDGSGVSPDNRERVFEPGYSDAGNGTGLGLTIVERIAVAHGWTVTLEESGNGGARFEFRFRGAETDQHGESL